MGVNFNAEKDKKNGHKTRKPICFEYNKGTKAFLSSEHLDALEKHLSQKVYMDSKGIVAWIEKEFRISYSVSGILKTNSFSEF